MELQVNRWDGRGERRRTVTVKEDDVKDKGAVMAHGTWQSLSMATSTSTPDAQPCSRCALEREQHLEASQAII